MTQAPYFSLDTPLPAWARLINGDNNRIAFEIDARGSGLIGGVTPQILIPHGETVSLMSSAMVQNTMTASANGYEGISHDLQGFVKGPTGSPVRVWRNNPLTSGDPTKWITDNFSDYRRVTFIDQMPENISPEWIQSTWFTKGTAGQTRFANFEFRDHYSRRYKKLIPAAEWTGFQQQVNTQMVEGRDVASSNRYLETIITRISKGQPLGVEISSFIESATHYSQAATRLIFSVGLALKMTRVSDGGSDWFAMAVGSTNDDRDIVSQLIQRHESFVAKNAYRQLELVMFVFNRTPNSTTGPIFVKHGGIRFNIQIDDSVETGSQ